MSKNSSAGRFISETWITEPLKGYTIPLTLQGRHLLSLESNLRSRRSLLSASLRRFLSNRQTNLKNETSGQAKEFKSIDPPEVCFSSSFNVSILFALTYLNHYLKNGISAALGEDVIGMCLTVTLEVRAGLTIWDIKWIDSWKRGWVRGNKTKKQNTKP